MLVAVRLLAIAVDLLREVITDRVILLLQTKIEANEAERKSMISACVREYLHNYQLSSHRRARTQTKQSKLFNVMDKSLNYCSARALICTTCKDYYRPP